MMAGPALAAKQFGVIQGEVVIFYFSFGVNRVPSLLESQAYNFSDHQTL